MHSSNLKKTVCVIVCMIQRCSTYPRSGSINQPPSHSHPGGGMKLSCLSLIFPVTSENLGQLTSAAVPHFPNKAWFSYFEVTKDVFFFKKSCTIQKKFVKKFIFEFFILPFQHRCWSFLQRTRWTLSLEQRGRATCWHGVERESSNLCFYPWDT